MSILITYKMKLRVGQDLPLVKSSCKFVNLGILFFCEAAVTHRMTDKPICSSSCEIILLYNVSYD